MKKLNALLITIFLGFSLFAETNTLESVCSKLAENPNTVGDFTQIKTIKSNGRQLKSTGKFIISTEGVVWETIKPFGSCVIFTEDKMIQKNNKGKISVMDGKDNLMFENISTTMIAVFAGDTKELQNNFIVDFSDNGKGSWKMVLTPRDETIKAVMNGLTLVGIGKNNKITLDSLEMKESSGNTIKYIFSNQSYPKELSAHEKEYFTLK